MRKRDALVVECDVDVLPADRRAAVPVAVGIGRHVEARGACGCRKLGERPRSRAAGRIPRAVEGRRLSRHRTGGLHVVLSFLYWAFRRLLELVVLRLRSAQSKDIEILVLRHQLHVLAGEGRPRLEMADRTLLAALSRVLPRADWRSFLVRPDTLLRWHRELVRRRWTYSRGPGRPPIAAGLRELISAWLPRTRRGAIDGSKGELVGLGISVAPSTVWSRSFAVTASIQPRGAPV